MKQCAIVATIRLSPCVLGGIHSWTPRPDAADAWTVDQRPFVGHKESVEDLQWSPTEANVFASGSVDKTLRYLHAILDSGKRV